MKNVMADMAKEALTYQPEVFVCTEDDIKRDKEICQEAQKRADREYMMNKCGKSLYNDLQKGYMSDLID
nr:MAG TPA: methyl-CpG binding protein-like protein [Caudoviricetes sp.]